MTRRTRWNHAPGFKAKVALPEWGRAGKPRPKLSPSMRAHFSRLSARDGTCVERTHPVARAASLCDGMLAMGSGNFVHACTIRGIPRGTLAPRPFGWEAATSQVFFFARSAYR